MRSHCITFLHEVNEISVKQKLFILEFIGDMESCLALKYEGLLLWEIKSSIWQDLRVSHTKWLSFAEQLIDNGFYSTAREACENTMLCLRKDEAASA